MLACVVSLEKSEVSNQLPGVAVRGQGSGVRGQGSGVRGRLACRPQPHILRDLSVSAVNNKNLSVHGVLAVQQSRFTFHASLVPAPTASVSDSSKSMSRRNWLMYRS